MRPLLVLAAGLTAAIAVAAPARAADCLPNQSQVAPCAAVPQPPCPVVELPCKG